MFSLYLYLYLYLHLLAYNYLQLLIYTYVLFILLYELDKTLKVWGLWNLQKQPPEVFFKKGYSKKFRRVHRKTQLLLKL